jgi:hypothetical protein
MKAKLPFIAGLLLGSAPITNARKSNRIIASLPQGSQKVARTARQYLTGSVHRSSNFHSIQMTPQYLRDFTSFYKSRGYKGRELSIVSYIADTLDKLEQNSAALDNPYLYDRYGIAPGTHIASHISDLGAPPVFKTGVSSVWKRHEIGTKENAQNTICSLYHHGVYIGNGTIFGFPEGLTKMEDFAKGNQAFYEIKYRKPANKRDVLQRAAQIIHHYYFGRVKRGNNYNFLDRNCEHIATFIATGRAQSLQVARATWVFLGGTLLSLVSAASSMMKKAKKLMRQWGFKPGMSKDSVYKLYEKKRQTYSTLWGRVPKSLKDARDIALSASKPTSFTVPHANIFFGSRSLN